MDAAAFPWDLNAGETCQLLDGVNKFEAFVLHEETHGRPVRLAAEAMVELLGWAYIEGRSLFIVKRAVCLVTTTSSLERNIRAYQIDDVSRSEDLLNRFLWNQAHNLARFLRQFFDSESFS